MLTYFVHFENKGNRATVKVVVTDVLDAGLDETRLAFVSDDGIFDLATRTLRWELDIALQPGETRFVTFRIAVRTGLAPGAQIKNVASIVFDFKPPIVTDPVIQTIGTPAELGVQGAIDRLMRLRNDVGRSGSRVAGSLLAKLDQVIARAREGLDLRHQSKETLAGNRLKSARNTFTAFLNEVRAQEGRHVLSSQALDWGDRGEALLAVLV